MKSLISLSGYTNGGNPPQLRVGGAADDGRAVAAGDQRPSLPMQHTLRAAMPPANEESKVSHKGSAKMTSIWIDTEIFHCLMLNVSLTNVI